MMAVYAGVSLSANMATLSSLAIKQFAVMAAAMLFAREKI
jgi:hypothetical protein